MSTRPIPYLFHQTSRAETPNAPAFDPAKKTKSWVDPSPAVDGSGQVTYTIVKDDYSGFSTMTISGAEARVLNLPGHPQYPAWVNPPSRATFNGTVFPVSQRADADALAAMFPGSTIFDEMANLAGTFPLSYPADDPRRAWGIRFVSGVSVQVVEMLAKMYVNGVGAPGHWSGIDWISDLPSPDATSPVMPVPVGPVAPGSSIVSVNLTPMLQEPDAPSAAASGSSGGGLLPDERTALLGIWSVIKKVYAAFV